MKIKSSKANRKEHRKPAVVLTKPDRERINKRMSSWNETPSQGGCEGKPKKHGTNKKPAGGLVGKPPG